MQAGNIAIIVLGVLLIFVVCVSLVLFIPESVPFHHRPYLSICPSITPLDYNTIYQKYIQTLPSWRKSKIVDSPRDHSNYQLSSKS